MSHIEAVISRFARIFDALTIERNSLATHLYSKIHETALCDMTCTALRQLDMLLQHCSKTVRDYMISHVTDTIESSSLVPHIMPTTVDLIGEFGLILRHLVPDSPHHSTVVKETLRVLSTLAHVCTDSGSMSVFVRPILSPFHQALLSILELNPNEATTPITSELLSLWFHCLASFVYSKEVYKITCSESNDCLFILAFRCPSMIRFHLSHLQKVALVSKIFDIGFALLTPFPRVPQDLETSSSTLPGMSLETSGAISVSSSSAIPSSVVAPETPLLETSLVLEMFASSSCTCGAHFVEAVVKGLSDVTAAIEEEAKSHAG
jgi:hypothetical protein